MASSRINIDEPRYDQSTFIGRAKHFFITTNPLNLFTTPQQLEEAKNIVEKHRFVSYSFLAHLSQRLMGELIVYQSLRRQSVCLSTFPLNLFTTPQQLEEAKNIVEKHRLVSRSISYSSAANCDRSMTKHRNHKI